MLDEKIETAVHPSHISILEPGRLVMDPAMLRLLSKEKIRNIAVIALQANVKAQQEIIEELKGIKF